MLMLVILPKTGVALVGSEAAMSGNCALVVAVVQVLIFDDTWSTVD